MGENSSYKLLRVKGKSMEPLFREGDLLLVEENLVPQKREIVVFKRRNILVAHRIYCIIKIFGRFVAITKGDNNPFFDFYIVGNWNILGKIKKNIIMNLRKGGE